MTTREEAISAWIAHELSGECPILDRADRAPGENRFSKDPERILRKLALAGVTRYETRDAIRAMVDGGIVARHVLNTLDGGPYYTLSLTDRGEKFFQKIS
jgi:hypothetical protein